MKGKSSNPWPPLHVDLLKQMWATMSATEIAKWLNAAYGTVYTRSSIIGKTHRLGLSKRLPPSLPKAIKAPKHESKVDIPLLPKIKFKLIEAERNMPRAVIPAMTWHSLPESDPINIMKLTRRTCRWPIETPSQQQMFCGTHTHAESVYCQTHAYIAAPHVAKKAICV